MWERRDKQTRWELMGWPFLPILDDAIEFGCKCPHHKRYRLLARGSRLARRSSFAQRQGAEADVCHLAHELFSDQLRAFRNKVIAT